MNYNTPDLSVVILCYRAESFAPIFIERMQSALESADIKNYEIIAVANYHGELPDKTANILSNYASRNNRLHVVAKTKRGMMGWDMQSGLRTARGMAIAIIDGDGQMPPEDVIKVYNFLRNGNYDVVKTYREKRMDGVYRISISRVYNALLKLFFPRVRVRDANSKPKVFTRDALERLELTNNGWFIDAEIIIQASYRGLDIGETPTIFRANENRPSFIKFGAVIEFIGNLLLYRLKYWFKT